ncbi:heavy-metal-associated domain-containing protein [Bacillus massiliglaciei]|uniref:heavy-metal-associated domain-containing protein n=1 Tax=Bacillus massiliglaciei TaxID=1816693 RepID=UPI000DA5ECD3|nr:hypothetical protein [Bacillus massiliglaciei]
MKTATFYVKEATSEGPIQNLQMILLEIEGIQRAIVDVDDGEVKIDYSEAVLSQGRIINVIEEYGLNVIRS